MNNTVRQKILGSVSTELLNIKIANGYKNTIKDVKKGFFDGSTITNFPTACVYFGNSILQSEIEGLSNGLDNADLIVLVYINSPADQQVDNAEILIEDVYRFFNKDENLNQLFVSHLQDLEYVQGYNIVETNPYVAGKSNMSCIGFLIKIQYVNFVDADSIPVTPDTPTLVSPADGYSQCGTNQAFDWSDATNANTYEIQIATDAGFSNLIIDQSYLVKSSFTVPSDITLVNGTIYHWRVRSLGTILNSVWSTNRSFTVNQVVLPDVPTLATPANNATNVIRGTFISWDESLRSDSYSLQVATDSTFGGVVVNASGLLATAYNPSLSNDTDYWWRVKGDNSFGSSAWSSSRKFSVHEDLVPAIPVLVSPADGTTGISLTPEFIWDTSIKASTFTLEVATDSTFGSLVKNVSGLQTTNYSDSTALNYLTPYYWKVKADNSYGSSAYTGYRTFTTGYDTDAQNLFNRMVTQPNATRKGLINTLIAGLKTDGVWSKLGAMWMFASHTNNDGEALLNWVQPLWNFVLTYDSFIVDQGITSSTYGAGFSNFKPLYGMLFTQNSCHMSIYSRTNANLSGWDIGEELGHGCGIASRYSGNFYGKVSGGQSAGIVVADSLAHYIVNRSASNARQYYKRGVSIGSDSVASQSLDGTCICIGAQNTNLGYGSNAVARQYAMASVGASLSSTDALNFYNRIQTFLTAIGANV